MSPDKGAYPSSKRAAKGAWGDTHVTGRNVNMGRNGARRRQWSPGKYMTNRECMNRSSRHQVRAGRWRNAARSRAVTRVVQKFRQDSKVKLRKDAPTKKDLIDAVEHEYNQVQGSGINQKMIFK